MVDGPPRFASQPGVELLAENAARSVDVHNDAVECHPSDIGENRRRPVEIGVEAAAIAGHKI
jgi:hypothetical protein